MRSLLYVVNAFFIPVKNIDENTRIYKGTTKKHYLSTSSVHSSFSSECFIFGRNE